MQNKSNNKAMTPESTTQKAALEQYHFAGGGEYAPITIEAASYEEALKKYEEIRVPTTPPAPLPLQDKDVVE